MPAVNKSTSKKVKGLTEGERDAVRARVQELKAEARMSKDKAEGERAVLAAITKMPAPYRAMGEQLHAIIKASAPDLMPKTWYGLPAYTKNGKVVCYLRMNPKPPYNDRYMTFGFNEAAKLDEGAMWATSFALTELTSADEKRIITLVKKAAG
jgi:uncharacterized protein YdhG (YjbR/CyaY superfamily)